MVQSGLCTALIEYVSWELCVCVCVYYTGAHVCAHWCVFVCMGVCLHDFLWSAERQAASCCSANRSVTEKHSVLGLLDVSGGRHSPITTYYTSHWDCWDVAQQLTNYMISDTPSHLLFIIDRGKCKAEGTEDEWMFYFFGHDWLFLINKEELLGVNSVVQQD